MGRKFLQGEWLGLGLVLLILVLDQTLKFWVKTHMYLGETIPMIDNWANLCFVENYGIAFGMKPDSEGVKYILSGLRIAFVGVLCYTAHFVYRRTNVPRGIYYALVGIIAGALGNVIDGTFYGILFSDSSGVQMVDSEIVPTIASFLPDGGGYASLLQGKVVDMFYFPLFSFYWPEWIPFLGGGYFEFFSPIFNFADAAISVSIIYILLFHWRYLFKGQIKINLKR